MIEYTRANMVSMATHYVGNKGLGHQLTLTEKPYEFKDDITKDIFFNFLVSGFKNDIYYHFTKEQTVALGDVRSSVENIFKDNSKFFESTLEISNHLYNQSIHPKINGGELYVALIKDVIIDGVVCDAVGIFKSESKETFITVEVNDRTNTIDIEADLGISPSKLDKGVLIFNIEQESGYKAVMVDNSKKINTCAFYWSKDFLDMELKDGSYLNTSNYINQCIGFCEEVLIPENNVSMTDKMQILNNSIKYFDNNVDYNKDEFNTTVLNDNKDLIESFQEHQVKYFETYDIDKVDNFTISKTAVKKNKKLMSSTIKLDSNFDITIKGRHDLIERGYDDNKGMGFYKLYFITDTQK